MSTSRPSNRRWSLAIDWKTLRCLRGHCRADGSGRVHLRREIRLRTAFPGLQSRAEAILFEAIVPITSALDANLDTVPCACTWCKIPLLESCAAGPLRRFATGPGAIAGVQGSGSRGIARRFHGNRRAVKKQKLILANFQAPGDIVMLTAAVRDLHACYPGRFLTDVQTTCPELWENNPHVTPLDPADPEVRLIWCQYPLITRQTAGPSTFSRGLSIF
jgi:hypothetical protein